MARTKDSVRAVDVYESDKHQPSQDSQPYVEITDLTEKPVTVLYEPSEDYPYPNQIVFRGTFEYSKEGVLGTSSGEGSFQLRLGSGMFVVRMSAGSAQLDEIVDVLDEELDNELGRAIEVHSDLADSSDAIWEVLKKATWIGTVVIRYRGERTPVAELREEKEIDLESLMGEYPLIEADFILETPWGEAVNVVYDDGRLEIPTESDDTHEYVLQLLEAARAK